MNIDDPILRDLKELQKTQATSLGRLVSELLAQALRQRKSGREKPVFQWISKGMGARVDLADKDALYAAMDREATEEET